jgi:hypothetical protein
VREKYFRVEVLPQRPNAAMKTNAAIAAVNRCATQNRKASTKIKRQHQNHMPALIFLATCVAAVMPT